MEDVKFYLFLATQGLAVLLLLAFTAVWPGVWNTERVVGSVLLISGMLLVLTARFQLGRSFSVTPQAKNLVTRGLYSKIRNPIYVFGALAIAGLFLILHRPGLWILFALVVLMQILRGHKEAQVLEAKFGDDYRAYRSRTWF